MEKIWADCIIAGRKSLDSIRYDRREAVKAELEQRLNSGELSQERYNAIFGIGQEPELELNSEAE